MGMESGREILEAAGNLGEGEPMDFVNGGVSVLLFGLANLPPAEREAYLAHVEAGGLRRSVDRFLTATRFPLPMLPGVPYGSRN